MWSDPNWGKSYKKLTNRPSQADTRIFSESFFLLASEGLGPSIAYAIPLHHYTTTPTGTGKVFFELKRPNTYDDIDEYFLNVYISTYGKDTRDTTRQRHNIRHTQDNPQTEREKKQTGYQETAPTTAADVKRNQLQEMLWSKETRTNRRQPAIMKRHESRPREQHSNERTNEKKARRRGTTRSTKQQTGSPQTRDFDVWHLASEIPEWRSTYQYEDGGTCHQKSKATSKRQTTNINTIMTVKTDAWF